MLLSYETWYAKIHETKIWNKENISENFTENMSYVYYPWKGSDCKSDKMQNTKHTEIDIIQKVQQGSWRDMLNLFHAE